MQFETKLFVQQKSWLENEQYFSFMDVEGID